MSQENPLKYLEEFLKKLNISLSATFPDKKSELEKVKNELLEKAKNYKEEELYKTEVLTEIMTFYYEKLSSFLPSEELSKILGEAVSKILSEI